MLERDYQLYLKKRIESETLPGSFVIKNDANWRQGIPDLTVLWRRHWGILEVKTSKKAPYQPNQEWYLERFDGMSFAATIYPENEEEVLDALEQTFRTRRAPRVSKRQ